MTREASSITDGSGETRLARMFTALLFLGFFLILVLPLFAKVSWLVFVQDDFLYYLKVAQNIASAHGSTFNGITRTNGYQPLWLFFLVALSHFTKSPRAILGFLAASNFLAAAFTFALATRLLRTSGVRPLLVFAFAAWTSLYSMTLFFYGMEVTLTVPLVLFALYFLRRPAWLERSPLHTFAFGLLLSAMVLSRIDTLILGGLFLATILLSPPLRRLLRPTLVLGALCGLLPLAAYFAWNRVAFGTWLPVSGMAKQLRFTHTPSLEPWRVFFHPLAGFFTLILLAGLCLLPTIRRRVPAVDWVFFPSVLLFPFLYYFVLSCVSDWTLWGWYMYPIRPAVCVSFLCFCLVPPLARFLQRPAITGLLVLSVFVCLALMRWTRQQTDIYAASVEIQQFAAAHPGIYAMGDRAGRPAYLMPDPIVQTEGLMMDRAYLANIEHQVPLREALARYNVRYYIATAYHPFTGCFQAAEPAKAGPTSAHMRAEFCEPPVATYFHDGHQTLIYDLAQPTTMR